MSDYRKRQLVYIKFWDHASGPSNDTAPIMCEVFGILKEENKLAYTVVSWICSGNLGDPNSDCYCILKSAVLTYRVLEVVNEDANEK